MVGGSTRVPMVQEKIKAYFGKELNIEALTLMKWWRVELLYKGEYSRGDVKDVLLLDVTPSITGVLRP